MVSGKRQFSLLNLNLTLDLSSQLSHHRSLLIRGDIVTNRISSNMSFSTTRVLVQCSRDESQLRGAGLLIRELVVDIHEWRLTWRSIGVQCEQSYGLCTSRTTDRSQKVNLNFNK